MMRWLRCVGSRCSRSLSKPMLMSSAASSASRPAHGAEAEWALCPLKVKLGGNQRVLPDAILGSQLFANMSVKRNVNVLEIAVAHKIGPWNQKLLGRRAKDLERPRKLVLIHRLFNGKSRP